MTRNYSSKLEIQLMLRDMDIRIRALIFTMTVLVDFD